MRSIIVKVHPLLFAALLVILVPAIAIAAGTVLTPPVSVTGSSSANLVTFTNNGTGRALKATSVNGNAVQAIGHGNGVLASTTNQSNSTHVAGAGIAGYDLSTDGGSLNFGVFGQSAKGTGVTGQSTTGRGVKGTSTSGEGVRGETSQNSSVSGVGRSAVIGEDLSTDGGRFNVGVAGTSQNGFGIQAFSRLWGGADISGGSGDGTVPALSIRSNGVGFADLIDACSIPASPCSTAGLPPVFRLTQNGDIHINGQIFTAGSCNVGCSPKGRHSARVVSYAPRVSQPTMEDIGEGQLVNGRASITLDGAFRNVIDLHAAYVVFLTPEGNSHGLYVESKSAAGFVVRENDHGHSSISFNYRIVAKPYGSDERRLPMIVR